MKKKYFLCILCFVLFFDTVSYGEDALDKLGRGMTNLLTGWIDLFTTMGNKWDEDQNVPAVLSNIPKGLAKAYTRTAAGAYETITFPHKNTNRIIIPDLPKIPLVSDPEGVRMAD